MRPVPSSFPCCPNAVLPGRASSGIQRTTPSSPVKGARQIVTPASPEPLHYTPFAVLVFVATTSPRAVWPCTFADEAATRLTELVTVLFGEEILDHEVSVTALGQMYSASQTVAEQIPNLAGRLALRTAKA